MNSPFHKYFEILFLLVIFTAASYAQDATDALRLAMPGLGSNARALGMGNSYISLSDDASAAFFNPAGFGLLKRLEFSGGLSYSKYNNDAQSFGNTTPYSNSTTRLDRVSFAFPFPTVRGSLVFGLSYHNTKDLTGALKYDGFSTSDKLEEYGDALSSGGINNWTFSGAIEVSKNVFIGGNLNIISGDFKLNNDYYEANASTVNYHQNNIINWDLSGWDAKVGFLYQLNNNARFGFTAQFPKSYTVKEDFSITSTGADDYSDKVKYDIITPYELGAGFSVNFKGLIFSAEATLIDYSQTEFDNADGLSTFYVDSINKSIKNDLASVFNYNVGIEYTIPDIGIRVRGGYFVQPSAYKTDPSGYDRKYITAGIGFLTEETIGLDLGYAHGWWKDFSYNYAVIPSRVFQDIAHDKVILTATYRF